MPAPSSTKKLTVMRVYAFAVAMGSNLSRAIDAICAARGTTASAIAAAAGIAQPTLSRACAGRRLEERTLRSLCAQQVDPQDGLDILIAHLRDEVTRSGRSEHEVEIQADGRALEPDLRLLASESSRDLALRDMLADLAALCRARPLQYPDGSDATIVLAAESSPIDQAIEAGLDSSERAYTTAPHSAPGANAPGESPRKARE